MSGEGRSSPCSAFRSPLPAVALCFTTGIAWTSSASPGFNTCYALFAFSLLAWVRWERITTLLIFTFMSGGFLHLLQTNAQRSAPFFDHLANGSLPVTVEGVVTSPPRQGGRISTRTQFELRIEKISGKSGKAFAHQNRILVAIRGSPAISYGDRFRLRGILRRPNPRRNPASFDYAGFLRNRGIHAELFCNEQGIEKLEADKGNPVIAAGLRCRKWISEQITRGLGENETEAIAIIRAMTLGQRDTTPDYLTDKFRFSGTLHVFAVSGLHVGIVAVLTWFGISVITSIFGLHRNVAVLAVILAVVAYAIITGLRPSACRAAVMAVIFFGGMLFGREPRVFNSTAAAALVILLFDTNQLFRPGFQLSFCVLISIVALATPVGRYLERPFLPDPFLPKSLITPGKRIFNAVSRKITGLTAMSIAAWAGSSLLTWYFFGLITPVSIIANLLLIPLAFMVLGTAALAVILAPVGHPLPAEIINESNALWAKTAAATASTFSQIPGGHWMVPSPARLLRDRCEINVLDLPYGGGACHIALRGGADWLIDSGSESAFRGSVHPLLRSYGSGRLDGLLLSHGDIGHVGGAVTAIQEYHPRRLLTTPLNSTSPAWRSALLAAREKGIHTESPAAGGKIDLGSGHHLHILYPPEKDAPGFVADDRCLVVQLRGPDGWRVLFMSDSGFYTERWLMENIDHDGLRSDVLIKGQHGSDYSGLPGFIDTVAPRAIIVSGTLRPASRNSLRNWKESIRDREIELFEQARSGAISIRLDAENAYITAFLDNQTLTLKRAD